MSDPGESFGRASSSRFLLKRGMRGEQYELGVFDTWSGAVATLPRFLFWCQVGLDK